MPVTAAVDHPSLLIAIPLYRTPELIPDLFATLIAMAEEIGALGGEILLINDSPDDLPLRAALDTRLPALSAAISVEVFENERNIGFVRSVNHALERARVRRQDILLLNSDALPVPGAFAEMVAVSRLDPMIAAVSPRSDNASICNSPYVDHYRSVSRENSLANHRATERHLPRYTYVPTAVGFCLLIPLPILQEFGVFDEIYGAGYNEENDFIRRCNQCGYRAVLANHAYVHHLGSRSFSTLADQPKTREIENRKILTARYPEYDRALKRFFEGPEYRTQRLLPGLIPDETGRIRLLFDGRLLGAFFNGTFELVRRLIAAFVDAHGGEFNVALLCDRSAFDFHGFDRIVGLRFCELDEIHHRPFAIAFRLGQPFTEDALVSLANIAPITGYLMLDTIALDCQQLDEHDLASIWEAMIETVDLIGYISAFARDQVQRRFEVPDTVAEFVALCSTDVRDYAQGPAETSVRTGDDYHVLVVGNHYPHKWVRNTIDRLRADHPDLTATVLGVDIPGLPSHVAGELPQDLVDRLYAQADLVLFPSHYEGFGLPILHALAHSKPIVARDLPPAREIRAHTPLAANIHLARSTEELVALAASKPVWHPGDRNDDHDVRRWSDAADVLARNFRKALDSFDYGRCRRHQSRIAVHRRLLHVQFHAHENAHRAAAIDVERRDRDELIELLHAGRPTFGNDLVDWRSLPAPIFDTPATWPDGRATEAHLAHLELIDPDGGTTFEALEDILMREARRTPYGGSITLAVAASAITGGARDWPTALAARVLMSNAGCATSRIEEAGDRIILRGVKLIDWGDILPGPAEDAIFVRACYRRALGRDPDPTGQAFFTSILASHGDREAILRSIYQSAERRDMIAQALRDARAEETA